MVLHLQGLSVGPVIVFGKTVLTLVLVPVVCPLVLRINGLFMCS